MLCIPNTKLIHTAPQPHTHIHARTHILYYYSHIEVKVQQVFGTMSKHNKDDHEDKEDEYLQEAGHQVYGGPQVQDVTLDRRQSRSPVVRSLPCSQLSILSVSILGDC